MLSNKSTYALRAVLELARSEGRGPMPIHEIAEKQAIPARFLEAILRELKQAGLTDSVRGKEGGYFLSKRASEVTVGDVTRIIEGPIITLGEKARRNPDAHKDVFNSVMDEAERSLLETLDRHTFYDLVKKDEQLAGLHVSNYSI